MLTSEFTSLEEPTDVSEVAAAVVFPADRPDIVTPRLLLKAELLCYCAIPWISR
jgi:hypothetical protein